MNSANVHQAARMCSRILWQLEHDERVEALGKIFDDYPELYEAVGRGQV